jgi:UDP-GlcNAc3NAcA epimerase
MCILSIIGARPQFIKCSVVSKEIRKHFDDIILHTGQHYDYMMSKQFFDELEIPTPDINLGVGSNSHGVQTAEMLRGIEKYLIDKKPQAIVVYGDTNSTLAGALAASKLNIPLVHIEAGLRSFDKTMPEEINRILTDHCSSVLCCPTQQAVDNLCKEGITKGVFLTGDTMVDSLIQHKNIVSKKSHILQKLNLKSGKYHLATIHRSKNTDEKKNLKNILTAFSSSQAHIVFPVHPRTKKKIQEYDLFNCIGENVQMIDPVGYVDFLMLQMNADKILTDSGGIQKEAYLFKKPCITLRENTEWVETVEDGWNILVGVNIKMIKEAIQDFEPQGVQHELFGDGKSAYNIVEKLRDFF